jgi:hypothetical protein
MGYEIKDEHTSRLTSSSSFAGPDLESCTVLVLVLGAGEALAPVS